MIQRLVIPGIQQNVGPASNVRFMPPALPTTIWQTGRCEVNRFRVLCSCPVEEREILERQSLIRVFEWKKELL